MSLHNNGIEAFMAVIKHSTVHGAARNIGLTQTAVTQRVRVIERDLGITLFVRSRKGMTPTPEGEALLRYCQQVNELEGEFYAALGGESPGHEVRVNIHGPSSIMRSRVIPSATSLLGDFEKLTFTFNIDDDLSGLGKLKSGVSQLAVLRRQEVVDELDSKLLRPAEYVMVAPKNWAGRKVKEIVKEERIIDFNESDDATSAYLKKYRMDKLARPQRHLANNTDALAMLVVSGAGYSVLSTDFAEPLFASGDLVDINPGKKMKYDFALAWYPRHEMPDYFGAIIDAIG
jgi:LysR family transcriptional regulator, chromosome initiation inhibitor